MGSAQHNLRNVVRDSVSVAITGFARIAAVGSNGCSQSGNFLDLLERLTKKGLRGIG